MNRREFLKKSGKGLAGIIAGISLISGCGKNPVKYSIPVDFDTISQGHWSGIDERKFLVINNNTEWNKIWEETFEPYSPRPNVPNIDFLEYTVLALYRGECPTTGYGINIHDITESNNSIYVKVSEKTPQEGDFVAQAVTQPYHIVRTPKLKKQVIFELYIQ